MSFKTHRTSVLVFQTCLPYRLPLAPGSELGCRVVPFHTSTTNLSWSGLQSGSTSLRRAREAASASELHTNWRNTSFALRNNTQKPKGRCKRTPRQSFGKKTKVKACPFLVFPLPLWNLLFFVQGLGDFLTWSDGWGMKRSSTRHTTGLEKIARILRSLSSICLPAARGADSSEIICFILFKILIVVALILFLLTCHWRLHIIFFWCTV